MLAYVTINTNDSRLFSFASFFHNSYKTAELALRDKIDLMTFRNAWVVQIMKYFVNNKIAKDTRNDASTLKLYPTFSLAT